MTIKTRILIILISSAVLGSPAFAATADAHITCDSTATIKVPKMGEVTEAQLQAHIDKLQRKTGYQAGFRASHAFSRIGSRLHLMNMRTAMEDHHAKLYKAGCEEAAHGLNVEDRLEILEHKVNDLGKAGS